MRLSEALEGDGLEHVEQQGEGFAGIWPVGSRMLYHYVMNVLLSDYIIFFFEIVRMQN